MVNFKFPSKSWFRLILFKTICYGKFRHKLKIAKRGKIIFIFRRKIMKIWKFKLGVRIEWKRDSFWRLKFNFEEWISKPLITFYNLYNSFLFFCRTKIICIFMALADVLLSRTICFISQDSYEPMLRLTSHLEKRIRNRIKGRRFLFGYQRALSKQSNYWFLFLLFVNC